MKSKLAIFATLLAIAAPALAQHDKSWTLVLSGRGICGTLKRDRGGNPFEFTTTRGVVVRIADFPSLTTKENLYQGCSDVHINSAVDADEPATEENEEKARQAAREAKEDEKKDIESWLAEHCDKHPDEPGCKE